MSEYKLTVGIETHVQLKTKTKLFSGADNDDRDTIPNSVVNHIDFGLPGALPVLNEKAIELASKAAFALNTRPQKYSKFDRKHYFYPDLPMGYQISQYDQPIILGGYVDISVNGQDKRIEITRAHLEADAGKSIHPENSDYSLVDLNRSGTPLLEIVSEPQMHSAIEARAYTRELFLLMKTSGVSNANLYYGNMRFDVNVSVSKNDTLGVRAEIKNLNSFRSVEKAIEYEYRRQVEALESGDEIIQETRGWDDNKMTTYSMRSKENADDYRYMPEPDIPPIVLNEEYIEKLAKTMPELPSVTRSKLKELKIDDSIIELLIEADAEYDLSNCAFVLSNPSSAKDIANMIVNIELPLRSTNNAPPKDSQIIQKYYLDLISMLKANELSSNNAKIILEKLLSDTNQHDVKVFAEENNMTQNSNEDDVLKFVNEVIEENPKAVDDVRNGEIKAIGFLVGQIMKKSKGQINPEMAKKLLSDKIK